MEKHILSKSTFIRGLQCQKSLYLYKNFYYQRDPGYASAAGTFRQRNECRSIGTQIISEEWMSASKSVRKFSESVERTKLEIENGAEVIYEAAFQFDQVLAAVDILRSAMANGLHMK